MASIIKLKRSLTPGSVPSSLQEGEIAVNVEDKKLYVGGLNGGSNVQTVSGDQYNLTSSGNSSISFVTLTVDNATLSNDAIGFTGDDVLSVAESGGTLTFSINSSVVTTATTDSGTATATNRGFTIVGGEGIDTSASGNTITVAAEIATLNNPGVVRPNANAFTVEADGFMYLTDGAYGAVLTINGTTDEVDVSRSNGTVTIGLPNDVTIGNDLTVTRNLQVDGNLNVTGAVTYISSSTVSADDSMLKLAANNAADIIDVGVYGLYVESATSKYAGWFRDASDGIFKFYNSLEDEPTTTVDVSGTGYALGQVDAVIDGGSY
jgi:hypothetical protein